MSALLSASNASSASPRSQAGLSINDIPKTWRFTSSLPADPAFPTPADSHRTPRDQIGPRQVHGALFTWVRPEKAEEPELLVVSPAAMREVGIKAGDEHTDDFKATVAGNKLQGWDEERMQGGYPWAQCYGGFQFGQWAGQLGDGRAISLFETTNPTTGIRYELQLKGAGLTPYSRFADGKAVLRSSIREFVVSEALHAMGIPSTRALSLTLLPHEKVYREKVEPGAIVLRVAQSWLRLGTFDLLRARGDRKLIRKLATYIAEHVFGGWEMLPGRPEGPAGTPGPAAQPRRGIPSTEVQGAGESAENRFTRLYREIVRRNAETVAKWQAYGFMNGVLNSDNTSILGLSMDFGPFAFMDTFDPSYTPNHDDYMLRYSYKAQPTAIWWNLVRLGEAFGELMGAAGGVDDESFITDGVKDEDEAGAISRAEKLIAQAGEEFKAEFLAEYTRVMAARLGLKACKDGDLDTLYTPLLDTMQALELDFNIFFRRLGTVRLAEIATDDERINKAAVFFHHEGPPAIPNEADARKRIVNWLGKWRARALEEWGEDADADRMTAMNRVNPSFVPRGWVLDEIIERVEEKGERDVLRRVIHMATHPFDDCWHAKVKDGVEWQGDAEEERRWTGDVPRAQRSLQCSCSS